MENLPISPGWVFLIGGIAGMVTVIRARMFSWKNYEFLTSEEDLRQEVPMTSAKRWLLIVLCFGLAVYGGTRVHRIVIGIHFTKEGSALHPVSNDRPRWDQT
jgi:hypothetical protein